MLNEVQKHIRHNRASHTSGNHCVMTDRNCPFFTDNISARCPYYEQSVLPADDKLKAKYWSRFGLEQWDEGGRRVKACNTCGNNFDVGDSPRRIYCDECRAQNERLSRNKRARKHRHTKQSNK